MRANGPTCRYCGHTRACPWSAWLLVQRHHKDGGGRDRHGRISYLRIRVCEVNLRAARPRGVLVVVDGRKCREKAVTGPKCAKRDAFFLFQRFQTFRRGMWSMPRAGRGGPLSPTLTSLPLDQARSMSSHRRPHLTVRFCDPSLSCTMGGSVRAPMMGRRPVAHCMRRALICTGRTGATCCWGCTGAAGGSARSRFLVCPVPSQTGGARPPTLR